MPNWRAIGSMRLAMRMRKRGPCSKNIIAITGVYFEAALTLQWIDRLAGPISSYDKAFSFAPV